ncbi:MAG: Gfo/Idh/MocA family oxidoreductase, partial [Solirubrobacteraceae bacterium]
AAEIARDRARVVVVGDVGLELDRASWYDKELDLRLSRSYGPGRYDAEYEERGLDYPIGYVRWTERRNMAAFVELMSTRRIDVSRLVSESIGVEEAPAAYDRLAESTGSTLGVLLRYEPSDRIPASAAKVDAQRPPQPTSATGADARTNSVGMIGAGSFAQRVLIPSLRDAGFKLTAIASASGLSAAAAGERYGFDRVDTVDSVISDPGVGLVVIATRHASHAELAERSLRAGKHVFVEKPPAITPEQLDRLREARDASGRILAVGFNRRHAPFAERMRDHFAARIEPLALLYRVNAGRLDAAHWLNDLDDGGGRLIGEGCHFIDFACWMVGAFPSGVSCTTTPEPSQPLAAAQRFAVTLSFADGSIATILYGAGGASGVAKEYAEAHAGGRSAVLDDFRRLALYDGRSASKAQARRQDKGHARQAAWLREQVDAPSHRLAWQDPLQTMAVTFAARHSAQAGQPSRLDASHRQESSA